MASLKNIYVLVAVLYGSYTRLRAVHFSMPRSVYNDPTHGSMPD